MPRRDFEPLRAEMTRIQRLVFLSYRMDQWDEERLRVELLRQRRLAYESELGRLAAQLGCPGRGGHLRDGAVLSQLNEISRRDAESIINTYNYDLARAILAVPAFHPRANRRIYASQLNQWEARRAKWKNPQIADFTVGNARGMAQTDFQERNRPKGMARLEPRTGICPVCQGWIQRGDVSARVAANNPPPYHPFCPHVFEYRYDRFTEAECAVIWMGE